MSNRFQTAASHWWTALKFGISSATFGWGAAASAALVAALQNNVFQKIGLTAINNPSWWELSVLGVIFAVVSRCTGPLTERRTDSSGKW
jgi:hypothetical protein